MRAAWSLLRCPRCRGTIASREQRLECDDCGRSYPILDEIPLLVVDAHEELRQWSHQLHELVHELDTSRDAILAQLVGEGLLPRARARLQRFHDGLPAHRDRILSMFAAVGVQPAPRAGKDRQRVPGEGAITAYFPQIHRDWHDAHEGVTSDGGRNPSRTPEDEIEQSLAAIASVIPAGTTLGRTLVLGAGPARLTYELARRFGAGPVVALDLNPLPYLVAQRVLRGENVALHELPQVPIASTDVVLDRSLRLPGPVQDGITLVFADGLDPPVADAAFDTVVTPWFIDQIPHDLRDLVPVVRRVLAEGGAWLDHGPCIYHPNHTRLAHRYSHDEVLEIVAASGFEIRAHDHRALPYMVSPASAQWRVERVLSFWAVKGDAPHVDAAGDEAPWLNDPTLPVPPLPDLSRYVPPHPMFAAVIGLVDGRRSIAEIAALLVDRHSLPAHAATMGVTACLREIRRAVANG